MSKISLGRGLEAKDSIEAVIFEVEAIIFEVKAKIIIVLTIDTAIIVVIELWEQAIPKPRDMTHLEDNFWKI